MKHKKPRSKWYEGERSVQPHSATRKSCRICGLEHSKNSHRMHIDYNHYEPYCDNHDTGTGSKTSKFAFKECSSPKQKGSSEYGNVDGKVSEYKRRYRLSDRRKKARTKKKKR